MGSSCLSLCVCFVFVVTQLTVFFFFCNLAFRIYISVFLDATPCSLLTGTNISGETASTFRVEED
jgi:hypothetical protein